MRPGSAAELNAALAGRDALTALLASEDDFDPEMFTRPTTQHSAGTGSGSAPWSIRRSNKGPTAPGECKTAWDAGHNHQGASRSGCALGARSGWTREPMVAALRLRLGGWHVNHAVDVADPLGRVHRLVVRRWARRGVDLLYARLLEDAKASMGDHAGLFGAIEIRFRSGPVPLDSRYRIAGEVVAVSQTPKTE